MILTIPDEIINTSKLTEKEIRTQLALMLFEKNLLTFGQSRKLSGLDVISFQQELGRNKIPFHYDKDDFEQDLLNLKNFKR
ncbi:MAG: UPF0175 family protein [Bacteroidota bacterium]